MKRFEGKVAVITGAGSGIGRALSVELGRRGARLALADLNLAGLEETRKQTHAEVELFKVDVSRRGEVEELARAVKSRFGCVDLVVNNAGVGSSGPVKDLSYETFEWLFGINFWGVVHGTKAFLPLLLERPEANLVNVSSIFGLVGIPTQAAYCASKFAVRGFTEALRQEMRGGPVAVTVVHPGCVRTSIARNARVDQPLTPEQQQDIIARFERAMITSPEEAAKTIVRGIQRNAARVLIGRDARQIDLLGRLSPTHYDAVVALIAERYGLAAPPPSSAAAGKLAVS